MIWANCSYIQAGAEFCRLFVAAILTQENGFGHL